MVHLYKLESEAWSKVVPQSQFLRHLRDTYSKRKTATKKGTVNPVFEEALEYHVPRHTLRCSRATCKLTMLARTYINF